MISKKIVVLACMIVVVFACKHEIASPFTNNNGDTTNAICFEHDVLPVLLSNCAKSGCHDVTSHEGGYILNTYDNIIKSGIAAGNANKSELIKVLTKTGDGRMPKSPNAPLTAKQIQYIATWINEGAKNTTGCDVSCNTSVFTYSGAIKPMLTLYCLGCHSDNTTGVDLTTYEGIKTVVDNGKLWHALNHDQGYEAMPQNGDKLNNCLLTQVQEWIDNGAKNN